MQYNPQNRLEIHPFAELFPLMSDDEFSRLVEDIRNHGQQHPIITYRNRIIDGRNREMACQVLKIEPKFQEWSGTGSLLSYVVSMNLVRRHMNESQRSMVAAKLATMQRGYNGVNCDADGSEDGNSNASIEALVSQSDAAEMLNVSRASVQRATDVLRNGVSEVIEAVETGEISVSGAAEIVKQISRTKQKRMIRRGRESLKELASRLRTTKVVAANKKSGVVCLLSIPREEVTEDDVRVHLVKLIEHVPSHARFFKEMLFELDETDFVGEVHEAEQKILIAIDAGHREKRQIHKFIKLEWKLFEAALANMLEYATVEAYTQEGKTEMARGQQKTLYRRKTKVLMENKPLKSKEELFEEELEILDLKEGFIDLTIKENHLAF